VDEKVELEVPETVEVKVPEENACERCKEGQRSCVSESKETKEDLNHKEQQQQQQEQTPTPLQEESIPSNTGYRPNTGQP